MMVPDALPDPRSNVAALRAFVAVARFGTVSRAARVLGRTQPSISARLAALEHAWTTRLFRRAAHGMELTPEGTRLLPRAESVLRELEQLDHAAGLPVAGGGELRVGAGDALGRELLPRALLRLLRQHPGLEIRVKEGPGPRLLEALREGEIDLALVVHREGESAGQGIDLEPWIRSAVDLLAPPGAWRARGSSVGIASLQGRPLVTLQPGSGFRRHLESAFASAGIPFRPTVEVGNLSLVRRFVAAGLGMAPVPAVAFSSRDAGARTERRRLTGVGPAVYHRALRAGVPLSPAMEQLLRLLRRADRR